MRISLCLAAIGAVLGGCTPASRGLDLLDEAELGEDLDASFQRIPDGERPAPPAEDVAPEDDAPLPHGVVPRYVLGGEGTVDDCISVRAEGMPAIDVTGSLVATTEEQYLQLSTQQGHMDLHLDDRDDPARSTTFSIVPPGHFTDDDRACRILRTRVRRQIAAANAELAAHAWRTLEPLPVQYGNPDTAPEVHQEVPVAERPLQVIVQHGEAIARIPGVKVYERHPTPERSGYSLYDVHGDRETGIVLLTFAECIGDSCTCDPLFSAEIVRWSPETFEALDAHPCADPDAEDGRCRGIDYGF
jgi:hypothetical protein